MTINPLQSKTLQNLLDKLLTYLSNLRRKESTYVEKESDIRTRCIRLWDFYRGNQLKWTQGALDSQFAKPRQLKLQLSITNVTRYLTDSVADYTKNGILIDAKNPNEQATYDKILSGIEPGFDLLMSQLAKMVFLLKHIFVKVSHPENKIVLDIIPPSFVTVQPNKEIPNKADSLVYPLDIKKFEWVQNMPKPIGNYAQWDVIGNYRIVNENGKVQPNPDNPDNINPYNDIDNPGKTVIPLVPFRESFPISEYWNWPGAEMDVSQTSINLKRIQLNYLIKMQSFSQMVVTDGPKDMDAVLTVDPSLPIKIWSTVQGDQRITPKIEFLTPSPTIAGLIEAIDKEIIELFATWGVDPKDFIASGTARSAAGLQAANARLQEFRDNQKLMFANSLQELFKIVRIVWNTHHPEEQLSDEGVNVRILASPIHMDSVSDRIKMYDWELQHNLTTPVDIIMEEEQDYDSKDAEAKIIENAMINKRIQDATKTNTEPQQNISGSVSGSNLNGDNSLFINSSSITPGNTPLSVNEAPGSLKPA